MLRNNATTQPTNAGSSPLPLIQPVMPIQTLEAQVLLACARATPDAAQIARIEALVRRNPDWAALTDLAQRHGVVPLLYASLNRIDPQLRPTAPLLALRAYAAGVVQLNLRLTAELLRLLDLFQRHGITAVAYKGPMLAALVYGALPLREYGDLDILIRKRDFPRAKQIMLEAGYLPDAYMVEETDRVHLRQHHDYLFVHHAQPQLKVELQWGVMHIPIVFPRRPEAWFQRLETATLEGSSVHNLAAEDLLLTLCIHGSKHLWLRLQWICDVAELLRARPALDWKRIQRQARANGCERMLLLGVLLAHTLLDATPPATLLQQAHVSRIVTTLAAQVEQSLFTTEQPEGHDQTPFFYLRMIDRLRDRVRLCITSYPSLARPDRLARLYGLQAIQHIIGW